MSFYILPNPYDPRYAIPSYAMAEPPGRGTFTTKGPRRGTIQSLIPDPLSGYGGASGCGCKQRGMSGDGSSGCGCRQRGLADMFDVNALIDKVMTPSTPGGIPWVPIAIGAGVLYWLTRRK